MGFEIYSRARFEARGFSGYSRKHAPRRENPHAGRAESLGGSLEDPLERNPKTVSDLGVQPRGLKLRGEAAAPLLKRKFHDLVFGYDACPAIPAHQNQNKTLVLT